MSRTLRRGAVLVVLAVLECAWMAWFLIVPLPNAGNVGGHLRRVFFLARAFPEVVPGVHFDQSALGQAVARFSHLENLPQRLPIVLAAALIAGAALALGRLVIRVLGLSADLEPLGRVALSFGLGATGLGLATLIVGRLGCLGPWPIRIGLGLLVVLGVRGLEWRRWQASPAALARLAPLLLLAPFGLMMFLGAMLPTIEFDALEYHLQGPKEYYHAGRIAFLPHNVYTSMPFGVEMLHLLGMEVLDDWWRGALVGQLLVALFAPATAALIALTARRWASPRAAWVATLAYLSTPWVYRLAVFPFVEGPLCYYHAALVWTAARARAAAPELRPRLWGVAGLLAGGAMACKYPALISAVLPFGLIALVEALRRRSLPIVLAFATGWAVVMGPWLARNVLDTGNPVYPLAYRIFGGRHWDADRDARWSNAHGPRPITVSSFLGSVVDVAGRSDWQSPLYAALAPLALVRRGSRRMAWVLWSYVVYLFLTWWLLTHRLDRFWLPLLPALAVLAGIGADWVRDRAWSLLLGAILALAILTNLVLCSTELSGPTEWTGDLRDLRVQVPQMLNPPLARLDAELPSRAKVLLVGPAAVFHLNHAIVYNTVFDRDTLETLTRGRSAEDVRQALRRQGVTHIYVDWSEIARYRTPGNYGFTAYVTPERFAGWVAAGVLESPRRIGPSQDLYRVR